jgi:hypothetical protein
MQIIQTPSNHLLGIPLLPGKVRFQRLGNNLDESASTVDSVAGGLIQLGRKVDGGSYTLRKKRDEVTRILNFDGSSLKPGR